MSDNTYEAAYYKMMGGTVDEVIFKKFAENKARKLKMRIQYIFVMTNVPKKAYEMWKLSTATVNIKDFMHSRLKIKNMIRKLRENRRAVNTT